MVGWPWVGYTDASAIRAGGRVGGERFREFSEVGDLLFNYVEFLLKRNLTRDRHRMRAKTHLNTIDGLNTGFAGRPSLREKTDRSRMGGQSFNGIQSIYSRLLSGAHALWKDRV